MIESLTIQDFIGNNHPNIYAGRDKKSGGSVGWALIKWALYSDIE